MESVIANHHPKLRWLGSVISVVAGVTFPIIDMFVDIWSVLGKIRPLSGFPTWLLILLGSICLLVIVALIVSKKLQKPQFLTKKNVREWLRYAVWAIVGLFAGILLSSIITTITNKKNAQKFEECIELEQKYIKDGTHGLREFYAGDFGAAYDSLKLYCNTDPVAACYYGEIIFDGLWKGVEQHETTNALRLIDSSAHRQFYRAIFKMEDYYYRQNIMDEAIKYAEQYLRVSSIHKVRPSIKSNDSITIWSNCLNISFDRLLSYYIVKKDRQSAREISNIYYSCFKDDIDEESLDVLHQQKNIIADWQMGYHKAAEKSVKKLAKKYPGNPQVAILYTDIILGGDIKKIKDSDIKKTQQVEKVLIDALKNASQNSLTTQFPLQNESAMKQIAWYLSEIYDSTGYWMEAAEMEHLATSFDLINKYRNYETTNK